MGLNDRLQSSVRARRDDDDEQDYISASENGGSGGSSDEGNSESAESLSEGESIGSTQDSSSGTDEEEDDQEEYEASSSLKTISFGALARAQESLSRLPKSKKRKRSSSSPSPSPEQTKDTPSQLHNDTSTISYPKRTVPPSRPSKHAPQILSTRHAVSRKRTILLPPSTLKPRDPRFDPTVTTTSTASLALASASANRDYAFLTQYRESELQTLQARLKTLQRAPSKKHPALAAQDSETPASLTRQIASLKSHLSSAATKTRTHALEQAHRRREREALRAGTKKTPYFLKRGAARKEVERERVQGLGKRKREKIEKRREGRAVKGRVEMPGQRRTMDPGGAGGGRGRG